ncbi:MAG: tetratricopeptide repeat protein [Candidatus Electrothrix sp. Rat3]|nr:tetratricopeptide repeat protein [Candidatus Electrothrix rattekaaiensis]
MAEAHQDRETEAVAWNNLGFKYLIRCETEQAEEMFRKALAGHEALGNKEGMAISYHGLANMYEFCDDVEQAIALWKKRKKSLSLYKEVGHLHAERVQQFLDEYSEL